MDEVKFNKIKQKALDEHIPIIMDDTLEVINERFRGTVLDSILEIGTACGYSAGKIDTLERDEKKAKEAIENINELGLSDKIEVFLGDATCILPTFDKKYDMIFIDAAKRKVSIFF